ncbi:oxidoreductase [Catellatospora chokoriensis]|uniref:Short-chain dehydrogenase/reductase n=1 Tax=Catellatospora chokoriensis TaxID=310353 RepID=A0A8J3NS31_9ACTN|nr:oxidoreductase [Catellatospora chokoriensis]GIF90747.1 short-chain dehydrogenase/reductase [Catellatospora chokoriensis]
MTTWFITGASRGFGLEIARQALERGDDVVATARDPQAVEKGLPGFAEQLLAVALDVTDERQARDAVEAATARFGGIDVLVNNAGRGLLGAVEEAADAEVRAVFDTNVFGLLAVTRAVLPVMRAQGSGRIVNMSSVGGFVSWPGWGVYCATKFAVEAITESLRFEVGPFGVQAIAVEPGPFRTDFLDSSSLHRTAKEIAGYGDSAGAMRSWADGANHAQDGDPVKAATAILAVVDTEAMPARLALGAAAVADIEGKLMSARFELDTWREISLTTDYAAV